jgi:hypothetical protein
MATRADLTDWVHEALRELGGQGSQLDVAKVVWRRHEPDLRASGDLFYTWQYDIRWAATRLRKRGIMATNRAGEAWRLA